MVCNSGFGRLRRGVTLLLPLFAVLAITLATASPPAVGAPASTHLVHGTFDARAALVAPPSDGECGTVLYAPESTPDDIVAACQNDPAYDKYLTDTMKGAACSSDDARLAVGTEVTVRNVRHATVAVSKLTGGSYTKDQGDRCEFVFRVRVPDSPSYEVEVGNLGFVKVTKTSLRNQHWSLALHQTGH